MTALPWWAWVILAGVLGVAEMHVPGAYLVWIALGAAFTAATDAALGGTSIEAQLGTFAVASALCCLIGYFGYRRVGRRPRAELPLNERNRAMVGERGVVCEAFQSGRGKVR